MSLELIGGEHELLLRPLLRRVVMVGVKRIDDQGAIDFDGIPVIFPVEEDAPAKTTHGRVPRMVQYRVRPEGDQAGRQLMFVLFVLPRQPHLVQIQGCASPGGQDAGECEQEECGNRLGSLSHHRLGSFQTLSGGGP
jgi:hypothetical protein